MSDPQPETATKSPLPSSRYGKPAANASESLVQFGRFAGRWICAMNERREDGTWRPRPAKIEWTWFYTLSGHAVQDIWTPIDTSSGPAVVATNLRLFDVASNSWNVAWTNTQQSRFELWTGTKVNDEMVLTSLRDRRPVKIRFFNILPRQFQWSYEAATSASSAEFTPVLQMTCQRSDD